MFYKKGKYTRNLKEMFKFLKNHFKYYNNELQKYV
jgi:hypothetical protein